VVFGACHAGEEYLGAVWGVSVLEARARSLGPLERTRAFGMTPRHSLSRSFLAGLIPFSLAHSSPRRCICSRVGLASLLSSRRLRHL
jgi:hypothetical protein